jgi:hypothetical protein
VIVNRGWKRESLVKGTVDGVGSSAVSTNPSFGEPMYESNSVIGVSALGIWDSNVQLSVLPSSGVVASDVPILGSVSVWDMTTSGDMSIVVDRRILISYHLNCNQNQFSYAIE